MKIALFFVCALGLLAQSAPERPGNFNVRFEPTAKLQTGAEIPFQITVTDALRKPLIQARVTLQIETLDGKNVKVFKAPAVNPGVYIAKPVFPFSGEWNVYVEVHRNNEMSARTIEFSVPE